MSVKKIALGGGFLLAVLIGLMVVAAVIWPTLNDVKTGETPEYADLRPQQFKQPYERVFDAALATALALGWEVTAWDRDQGEIRAVATTRVFRFKDDVTITIGREGEGVVVNVRSRSRIGKGDLGTNARRIRQFQAELTKRI
ncbi:MAG: hypothetical protein A3J49_02855 [Gallionellales bacterium RIFCSPHIGHO2_02_FULL_57_16]|nr:MAG: hypothetical protein A3J49_02855 [Gallionellales bacterium RIFCSPHIGHO2_02_FULL_57_16]